MLAAQTLSDGAVRELTLDELDAVSGGCPCGNGCGCGAPDIVIVVKNPPPEPQPTIRVYVRGKLQR